MFVVHIHTTLDRKGSLPSQKRTAVYEFKDHFCALRLRFIIALIVITPFDCFLSNFGFCVFLNLNFVAFL